MSPKVLVIPCSGIGKCYGSVAREGAYRVVEDLSPDKTRLMPLSLVVLGGDDIRSQLSISEAVTIDGCKLGCAAQVVSASGGTVAHAVVVLDVHRRHRELKPAGIDELNDQGHRLAQYLADEVKELVDTMVRENGRAASS